MNKESKLYDVPAISSVQDMLIKSAARYGNKIALKDLQNYQISEATYDMLFEYVLRFGSALRNLGIKERTHIAVISENRVQWGITYLTSMTFNHVIIPIDRNLNSSEIMNIIHESDAEVIVFSEQYNSLMQQCNGTIKKLKHFICMDKCSGEEFFSMKELIEDSGPADISNLPAINPDEMAEIIFTSGSLGRAKGVMLSQKNLVSNLMGMTSMLFIYPEDRFLSVLPMHHTYECTCGFLCPVYSGASVYFARSLKTVADDIRNVKATMLLGVPLLYEKMFKKIYKGINENKVRSKVIPPVIRLSSMIEKAGVNNVKRRIFKELHEKFGGSVRLFIAGGAAPDPKVARGFRELGFTFVQGYGLTETAPILTLNRLDNFKDNAAGLPLPDVKLRINEPDEDGIGEVFASGPNVMLGYYKNEQLTGESFSDNWFKTGDLGFLDKDGFLHISGRKKNVIIASNGKNVFPEEIEDVLNRSEYVLESLVFGESDGNNSEVIAAQIVPDTEAFIEYAEKNAVHIDDSLIDKLVASEIKRINAGLSSYKRIKNYYLRRNEFEKTTTQKIKRYLVKQEPVE